MIKFGSRTELIVPALSETDITVKVGDKVKAGLTVMVRQPIQVASRSSGSRLVSIIWLKAPRSWHSPPSGQYSPRP